MQEIAHSYANIAVVYQRLNNSNKAIEYLFKALKINEELKNKESILNNYTAIGDFYLNQKEIERAFEFYNKATVINLDVNNKEKSAALYANLGGMYLEIRDYKKAMEFLNRALKIDEEVKDKIGIAYDYGGIGATLLSMGKYNEGIEYIRKSEILAKEVGDLELQKNSYKSLYGTYQKMSKPDLALKYFQLFIAIKDSIEGEAKKEEIARQEVKLEYGIKSVADSVSLVNEKKLSEEKLKQEETKRYSLYVGLLLLILFAGFMFNRFKVTQRQNKIIENQKHIVEEKQKEIVDSLTYAKRLQDAILPPGEFVSKQFPENFILYLPKDIVAGDFYWMEQIDGFAFIAAADSTGHGVPGAMVSVVCSNALNRAVKEFNLRKPGEILDKTRELVLETFEKSTNDVKDGMDISLLCFDKSNNKLSWAGANNPLWYIDKGELKKIVANKQAIGKVDFPAPFTTHIIEKADKQSIFFLFTDGYADQFGGAKGKKFKYKQLEEILLVNNSKAMANQKDILLNTFNDWKGDLEQVDDVCIIGLKI